MSPEPVISIDVSSALSGAHVVELSDGGTEVEELLGAGLAARLIEAANPLCTSINAVLDELALGRGSQTVGMELPLARVSLEADASTRLGRGKRKSRRARREAAIEG